MKITDIAFVKHIGIEKFDETKLGLKFSNVVENHLQSIHASAQFTLAETQSGLYLKSLFPGYADKVLPLLHSSSVKYRNPANNDLYAEATVDTERNKRFMRQFFNIGRASITIDIEVKDLDGNVTMLGEFNWFVQSIR